MTEFPHSRTAVVTGAASARGIGRATAARLAREGWNVAVLDLAQGAAEEAAADIARSHGVEASGFACDVTDEQSVRVAVEAVRSSMPQIVGLVNVAGISSPTPFLELGAAEWDRVFDVNMRGTFLVTRAVADIMVEHHIGRIASVSSASAQRGGGTYSKAPYSAAKAAVVGFTRAVARELGPFGITVNCVSPGPIDTDFMGGTLSEERKRELTAGLLINRIGTPDDVAALLAFLLSEDAGFITGARYDVNGGLHMG